MKLRINRTQVALATGLIVLIGGFSLLTFYVRNHEVTTVVTPRVAAAAVAPTTHDSKVIEGEPVRFQVPSLHMDLSVIDGYYDAKTGAWTLTRDKVQYATITTEPNNESGDTFLYGHYRKQVFASLHTIQPGAEAIVSTSNGHSFYYTLQSVKVVSPEDSASIFNYQGAPILTVQTCTGLFFQNRQLFTFSLERVE